MDAARWSQSQEMSRSSTPMPIHPTQTSSLTPNTNYTSQNPNSNPSNPGPQSVERRVRPHQRGDQPINCPRCNSTNTKFCYYNNYSLTQPRYFCKSCRRYWTEGGSLRNVPVGGGSRKNKKPSSSSFNPSGSNSNPSLNKLPSGLNIGFNTFPNLESNSNVATTSASAGTNTCGVFGSFGHMTVPEFSSGYGLQDLRPSILGFPLDGSGAVGASGVYGNMSSVQDNNRVLFPFEDLKPGIGSSNGGGEEFGQNRGHAGDANQPSSGAGFWNGMMGGSGSGGPGSW